MENLGDFWKILDYLGTKIKEFGTISNQNLSRVVEMLKLKREIEKIETEIEKEYSKIGRKIENLKYSFGINPEIFSEDFYILEDLRTKRDNLLEKYSSYEKIYSKDEIKNYTSEIKKIIAEDNPENTSEKVISYTICPNCSSLNAKGEEICKNCGFSLINL